MKKWILIACGTLVVIIAIILVAGLSNLGPIIKNAVNTYGPRMTKTEVRLGNVSISIFSGQAKLKDFYLGNPKGFKSPHAMNVRSIYMDVEEGSLIEDTIIIDKIEVVRPEITYEKKRGTDNLKTILNNLTRTAATDKPPKKQSGKESGGKKILIRNFILRDGKVNLTMSMLAGKSISAKLPDIYLKDLGKDKGGALPADAFKEVFASLYKNITSPAVTNTLNQELKAQGLDIGGVGDGAKKELKTVTGKVKGLFGN
jgi:uncharacterized protein involved in outer membrane biogenesis